MKLFELQNWNCWNILQYKDTKLTQGIVKDMHQIKNWKSPGIDGLFNELLKCSGNSLGTEFVAFINKICKYQKISQELKTNILIPVFKKSNQMNLENYRSINLLSTILKLIQKYSTKIQRYFEAEGLTAAFRKGQLCSNIFL